MAVQTGLRRFGAPVVMNEQQKHNEMQTSRRQYDEWITFFHEVAPILLHSCQENFVEDEKRDGEQAEKEADE